MRKTFALLLTSVLVVALAACSVGLVGPVVEVLEAQDSGVVADEASAATTLAASVAEALAENSQAHADAQDFIWEDSAVIPITLNGDSILVDGDGVTVDGSTATITAAGTYGLSGSLDDGQIVVSTADGDVVRLILNGVDIHSSTSAPLYISSAEEVVIVLADGAENFVSDGAAYFFEAPDVDEPSAAIFSNADLTLFGAGSLTVNGNYGDGIASDDGLVIAGGAITVNAVDDGLRGKDYLVIKDGTLAVTAQVNGLKSDNEDEADKGYVSIEAGVIDVSAGGDAIQAETDVMIAAGEITLSSGGGSRARIDANTSAKGIKAAVSVTIDGGTFTIDSADDAIHSNGSLTINGGAFAISTGDDGLHADSSLEVNAGDLRIAESYEGIESAVISINGGDLHIVSSDDGLNVAGGNDGSGMQPGMGPGGRPGRGPGQDAFTYTGAYYLYLNGGYIMIEAAGDGIDVNGAIEMTGGVVVVNGPTERMNGALDYDASFNITGGFLVAAGSSGMAQAPGAASSQYSVLINTNSTQPAGALVHIQNSDGDDLLTFSPTKEYQSIAFSSPDLEQGETYAVYYGGTSTGAVVDGLYQGGAYTPGVQYTSFTISSVVTLIGASFR